MLSKGLFIFIYTSKTGYESFQKQWISLLEVHHSICCAEIVPKSHILLCTIWEPTSVENNTMWSIGDWWMLRNPSPICCMSLSKDGFESLQRQWWYILAIVSHLLCFLRVPETWYFVCNLAVNLSETYHSVTHKWLTDAVNIFFELPYALNKGYGALQKQWMSILLVHHPIFNTYKGSPTLYFCLIW